MRKIDYIWISILLILLAIATFSTLAYDKYRKQVTLLLSVNNKLHMQIDQLTIKTEPIAQAHKESLSYILPIHKDDFLKYTSPYGLRNVPSGIYTGGSLTREHMALDLIGTWRARIVASANGKVIEKWVVPNRRRGYKGHPIYGGYIVIEHIDGSTTEYAHNSAIYVREGEIVKQGQVIARQGASGLTDGAHLHFALKIGGVYRNPLKYIEEE